MNAALGSVRDFIMSSLKSIVTGFAFSSCFQARCGSLSLSNRGDNPSPKVPFLLYAFPVRLEIPSIIQATLAILCCFRGWLGEHCKHCYHLHNPSNTVGFIFFEVQCKLVLLTLRGRRWSLKLRGFTRELRTRSIASIEEDVLLYDVKSGAAVVKGEDVFASDIMRPEAIELRRQDDKDLPRIIFEDALRNYVCILFIFSKVWWYWREQWSPSLTEHLCCGSDFQRFERSWES